MGVNRSTGLAISQLAEEVGFEPTGPLQGQHLSRMLRSATPALLPDKSYYVNSDTLPNVSELMQMFRAEISGKQLASPRPPAGRAGSGRANCFIS